MRKTLDKMTVLLLIATMLATLTSGRWLYFSLAMAVLLQVILWHRKNNEKKLREAAHNLQKIAMLQEAFGNQNTNYDVSSILRMIDNKITKLARDKEKKQGKSYQYNIPQSNSGIGVLSKMIQENSYWNFCLWRSAYEKAKIRLVFYISLLILMTFILIPIVSDSLDEYLLKFILVILSSVYLWEKVEENFHWKKSSTQMEYIETRIEASSSSITEDFILYIFSEYTHMKSTTPPTPKNIYDEEQEIINYNWNIRKSGNST